MNAPDSPPPTERARVEQLLIRLIQGHDEELRRLDGIRRAIDWTPLRMGCVLITIEIVAWLLRAIAAR